MLATFALEWRSNYPSVFGASVPRSQQPLGPCRHWASRASCLPNTCRYTGWANSPTTREPDERAGNCCQKPCKDLCKDREMQGCVRWTHLNPSYLPVYVLNSTPLLIPEINLYDLDARDKLQATVSRWWKLEVCFGECLNVFRKCRFPPHISVNISAQCLDLFFFLIWSL